MLIQSEPIKSRTTQVADKIRGDFIDLLNHVIERAWFTPQQRIRQTLFVRVYRSHQEVIKRLGDNLC